MLRPTLITAAPCQHRAARPGLSAHRWVHRLIRFPDTLFNLCSSARTFHDLAIAREPSWGAIRRRAARSPGESGRSFCPGKQHFANLLDSSGPALGLLHTEEVTGSIPVSPTRSEAMWGSIKLPVGAI